MINDEAIEPDMSVEIGGVRFKNPVMTASGTFGAGQEYSEFIDIGELGAVVTKGVADHPWAGNPAPRIAEVTSGMLNAIGLQNPVFVLPGDQFIEILIKDGKTGDLKYFLVVSVFVRFPERQSQGVICQGEGFDLFFLKQIPDCAVGFFFRRGPGHTHGPDRHSHDDQDQEKKRKVVFA